MDTEHRVVVVRLKSEPKCKLCRHAARDSIDQWLLRRSRNEFDGEQRINGEYVIARLAELGVEHPTKENLTVHWRKHCEVVEEQIVTEQLAELEGALSYLLEGAPGDVDVDEGLKVMFKVGLSRFIEEVKQGQAKITPELMIRLADALGRRKQNEATAELMSALGRGTALALERSFTPQLPPAKPAIEGEVVREE